MTASLPPLPYMRLLMRTLCFAVLLLSSATTPLIAQDSDTNGSPESALEVFRKRIEPIWKSPKPSSCSECHLSGVDLKNYLRDDQAATFTALRDAGLVDVKQPDDSKLLKLIARKPERPNLITDKVRQEEFAAMRDWLRLAVKDPGLLKAKA